VCDDDDTLSSYDYGWEQGNKARERYFASPYQDVFTFSESEPIPDVNEREYLKGFREGLIHAIKR
jgi:hypothetical protein